MKLLKNKSFVIQLICVIGWFTLFILQKSNYINGIPTEKSGLYSDLKGIFVIVSFFNILNYYLKKENDKT